ncbi:serine/threonine protein kinase [Candidatus Margulisiibacteriota bacterium]
MVVISDIIPITMDIWKSLNHDAILNTVEKVLNEKLSNLVIQRNSYINRVFELTKNEHNEKVIVKFYRPDRWNIKEILIEHEFLFKLKDHELNVIAPLCFEDQSLFFLDSIPFAIFPKKGGKAMDEFQKDHWQRIGQMLGRLHLIGKTITQSQRQLWKPDLVVNKCMNYLLNNNIVPKKYISSLQNITNLFLEKTKNSMEQEKLFLIHGDCHKGNLIHRPDEGLFIIDFDDICIGPAVQDLWMLLPGKPENYETEISWFLKGYETFNKFNLSSLELIPILKVMRILHFSGWCALQRNDKGFSHHFPQWGTTKYWNELIKDIQETVYLL